MAALPYIQLYVADYLGDTYHLTTEEHGAYLLLIMTYWQSGKPIHKSRLPSATRMTNERWANVERTLNEYFTEDENGYWIHDRIENDLRRVNAKCKQASKAGKASAAKRSAPQDTENKEDSNGRSTDVKQTFNHTYTYTDTKKTSSPRNSFSDDDLNLAKHMFSQIKTLMPASKEPNFKTWANTIRLMREKDNLELSDIRDVFDWANADDFWGLNIRGPDKLRKQYPRLAAQALKINGTTQVKDWI